MTNYQQKANHIASIFEGETDAIFILCCEDEGFKELFVNGVKSSNTVFDVVDSLCDYANGNLI